MRSTLSRARELCERWRSGGGATPAPPAPPPDDEGGGRLARWFSVRRGSSHQYDMHGHESDKMPKLPEVCKEYNVLNMPRKFPNAMQCSTSFGITIPFESRASSYN